MVPDLFLFPALRLTSKGLPQNTNTHEIIDSLVSFLHEKGLSSDHNGLEAVYKHGPQKMPLTAGLGTAFFGREVCARTMGGSFAKDLSDFARYCPK